MKKPVQTYRRDMRVGVFVMMKDASAPIYVNGPPLGRAAIGLQGLA